MRADGSVQVGSETCVGGEYPHVDTGGMGEESTRALQFATTVNAAAALVERATGFGIRLGRYLLLDRIGEGGMGVVHTAYDPELDRKVAVKLLKSHLTDASGRARLLREAQAMARLSHPNVVAVYDVGSVGDEVFIAMEFVQGVTLRRWLTQQPREWRQIMATFIAVGRGLCSAHEAGLVHRDLKPDNIMIGDDGRVRVMDLGLARASEDPTTVAQDPAAAAQDLDLSALTLVGQVLGTPAYMSPEQHRGEIATAASDQFSFCVSLFQGLYGVMPYAMDSLEVLRRGVLQGTIIPPPLRSPIPPRIYNALRRGMMPDPAQRFGSMAELLVALERDPMRRVWRGAALLGALFVSGGVSAVVVSANQVEVCPDARAELAAIWSPEQTARVEASMQTRVPAQAGEMMAMVGPLLEAYATEWTTMRNEACLAHAEGRQSVQLFDLRTSCLDQRRASLSATVEVLMNVDGGTLNNAIKAVRALPRLEACADVEALTAELPPPEDPELRLRVQQHREALTRAEVLEVTSQTREAMALTEGVLADAEALTYEPLLAEAYLRKGTTLIQEWSPTALAPLDEAVSIALRIGHTRVAALAGARRAFVLAEIFYRADEAHRDLLWVKALNQRVKRDVATYKEYLMNAANVQRLAGDWDTANALIQEAVALMEKNGSQETLQDVALLMTSNGLALDAHRYEEALALSEQTSALSTRLLGNFSSWTHTQELNRAFLLFHLGRAGEASKIVEKVQNAKSDLTNDEQLREKLVRVEFSRGNYASARQHALKLQAGTWKEPGIRPWYSYHLAEDGDTAAMEKLVAKMTEEVPPDGYTLAAVGKHREAVELFLKERTALEKLNRPRERFSLAFLALALGQSYQKLGEYDNAERELTASLSAYQALVSPRNLELAEGMRALGELALERQQFERAAEWLQKAEAVYTTTAEPDYLPLTLTRAALARARAHVHTAPTPASG